MDGNVIGALTCMADTCYDGGFLHRDGHVVAISPKAEVRLGLTGRCRDSLTLFDIAHPTMAGLVQDGLDRPGTHRIWQKVLMSGANGRDLLVDVVASTVPTDDDPPLRLVVFRILEESLPGRDRGAPTHIDVPVPVPSYALLPGDRVCVDGAAVEVRRRVGPNGQDPVRMLEALADAMADREPAGVPRLTVMGPGGSAG